MTERTRCHRGSSWISGCVATLAASFAGAQTSAPTATPQPLDQPSRSQSRMLTPPDVMRLRHVTSASLSPNGTKIVYSQTVPPRPEQGAARTQSRVLLLSIDTGKSTILLPTSIGARGVTFHPDGSQLTFVHKKKGDAHAEVWGISLDADAKPVKLTNTPHGVGSYAWAPNGGAIAFTVKDPTPASRAAARKAGYRQRVVDEDFDPISLWVFGVDSKETKQLTAGVTVFEFVWSPDGTRIAAAIAPRNLVDDRYMAKRLHLVDPMTGEARKLIENPGKLGEFVWSPEGDRLAYISAADRRDPHAGMLYVIAVPRAAEASTSGVTGPLVGTATVLTKGLRGMVHDIHWQGDSITAAISRGVQTELVSVDPTSGMLSLIVGHKGVTFRAFDRAAGQTVFVASTAAHPAEVFVPRDDSLARLTNSNPWLGEIALGEQQVVQFTARDGLEIEGLFLKPVTVQLEPSANAPSHPLVIVAHGGPESHFSDGWLTSYSRAGQILTGRGYCVWYPNYRASTGYGVEFAKLDHGDPMGGEFRDHIDAIAHFASQGLIDPTRVGIIGGSYGGYAAAWAATAATEHFAAAVSFVPFVDIRTKWYTSDISNEFYLVHYQEKWPHEQAEFLASRSPLTYAANCRTPILVLGGDADPRVHPSQPHMLYRAIKTATDTPVRYVQYPDEGHGNRMSTNRYDYLVRTLRWLEHYLRGGDQRQAAPPPIDLDYAGWR